MAADDAPRRLVPVAALSLSLALAGAAVLLRSFDFVAVPGFLAPYSPPAATLPGRISPGERRTAGVTLVLVDGMDLETSRSLPTYQALRACGADVETRALFPSFTLPGKTTMLTGASPFDHGLLANASAGTCAVPSIEEVAGRAGYRTASLSVRGGLEGLDLAPPREPYFRFVYVREPDATGHRRGAASEEYRAAALGADAVVAALAAHLDLGRETLIVATDHGHLPRGGHGGHEEVVLRIPLVLAGAGIRPGSTIDASAGSDLRDVAPTAAVLLGLPAPPGSTGRPLVEVLDFDPGPLRGRVAPVPAGSTGSPIAAWLAAPIAFASLVGILRPARRARPILLAALALAVFPALYAIRGHPVSFSCVHSVAGIPVLALEAMALAAAPVVAGALAARGDRTAFLSTSLVLSATVAAGLLAHAGFRAPAALAHPATSFGAVLALTALAGVCLAALLVSGAAAAAARRAASDPVSPVYRVR